MKRRHTGILYSLLAALALSGLATGCSTGGPPDTSPTLYEQQKLQAVDHWDNIAETVAARVQKALEDRRDIINKPIYIQPPGDRPFSMAFYSLLRSRLVSRGIQVSDQREADTTTLNYTVQTVLHESSSQREIIINTAMLYKNRYVMQFSTVGYIEDNEWTMYISPESSDPNGGQTRIVRLVDR